MRVQVLMWTCDPSNPNQHWIYNDHTSQVTIGGGGCLATDDSKEDGPGALVFVRDCEPGNPSQQWIYNANIKQIRKKDGRCLDASDRWSNGGLVHMVSCDPDNPNQQWDFNVGKDVCFYL